MKQISIRYPDEDLGPRFDVVAEHLKKQNKGIRISRSKAMLVALIQGLEMLERHFGIPQEL